MSDQEKRPSLIPGLHQTREQALARHLDYLSGADLVTASGRAPRNIGELPGYQPVPQAAAESVEQRARIRSAKQEHRTRRSEGPETRRHRASKEILAVGGAVVALGLGVLAATELGYHEKAPWQHPTTTHPETGDRP